MRLFNHAMFGLWAIGLVFLFASIWYNELEPFVKTLWAMPAGAYAGLAAAKLGW